MNFPEQVLEIVATHHEKWDGTGYPRGLKAEQIPIGARILSAVDCLDALASDRPYRGALTIDMAMARVSREEGRSFDPQVVSVLQRRYAELERMAWGEVTNQRRRRSARYAQQRPWKTVRHSERRVQARANSISGSDCIRAAGNAAPADAGHGLDALFGRQRGDRRDP